MVGSIMMCLHLDGCFLQNDPDVAATNQTSFWIEGGPVCFDFVLSEFMLRVVLFLLHLHIAYHVPAARTPRVRPDSWSVSLKVWVVSSSPAPVSRLSRYSISGGITSS